MISRTAVVWHVRQGKNDASVSGQNVILSALHGRVYSRIRQTECTDGVSVCLRCVFPLLTLAPPVLLKVKRCRCPAKHFSEVPVKYSESAACVMLVTGMFWSGQLEKKTHQLGWTVV